MIPAYWLANHMWQSTLFASVAVLLTLACKRNRAAIRYRIWQAASIKFLVPFSVLIGAGGSLGWQPASALHLPLPVEKLGTPFEPVFLPGASAVAAQPESYVANVLLAVWLSGFALVVISWCRNWRSIAIALRSATPWHDGRLPVTSYLSTSRLEPGIFGIVKPVLLLPAGIPRRLTGSQLNAVLAHEMSHLQRRDNFWAALHMCVEALFWFYPLVWWIGSRLVEERERACDEEVLSQGTDPAVYAEAILRVCEFYLDSPLPCAAGVTGANLKRRIEAIMSPVPVFNLDLGRKLLLAGSAFASLAGPFASGLLHASETQAITRQTAGPAPSFDVASIKLSERWKAGGEGRTRESIEHSPTTLTLRNVSLSSCVQLAYGVNFYQVAGPDWLKAERYDIIAKSGSPVAPAEMRLMLRTLLAGRFNLTLHRESRELPVYALVVARNGPKLSEAISPGDPDVRVSSGSFVFQKISMPDFAAKLSDLRTIDRPVMDRTGIAGRFDITLSSAASAMLEEDGPSIFTLIQEQLGLKLEPTKAPVEFLIIDHADRIPTGN